MGPVDDCDQVVCIDVTGKKIGAQGEGKFRVSMCRCSQSQNQYFHDDYEDVSTNCIALWNSPPNIKIFRGEAINDNAGFSIAQPFGYYINEMIGKVKMLKRFNNKIMTNTIKGLFPVNSDNQFVADGWVIGGFIKMIHIFDDIACGFRDIDSFQIRFLLRSDEGGESGGQPFANEFGVYFIDAITNTDK